jgi:hypothetical protein
MAVKKRIYLLALFITVLIFLTIFGTSEYLNIKRESKINELRDEVIDEVENMKAFTAITSLLDKGNNCGILQTQLTYLDKSVWELGKKLDAYEQASKNIFTDPFYKKQKKRFIVNQFLYLSVHEQMKEECNTDIPVTILYFYANSKDCSDCDAQSFVLTDINEDIDNEISIFSIDSDIDIIATEVLIDYYNLSRKNLPCTIIQDQVHCGLQDKTTITKRICDLSTNLSICY